MELKDLNYTNLKEVIDGETNLPEINILSRVASIPLSSSSFVTINDALTNNVYTRQPYAGVKQVATGTY